MFSESNGKSLLAPEFSQDGSAERALPQFFIYKGFTSLASVVSSNCIALIALTLCPAVFRE
jgi:hypothetical protein